MEKLNKKMQEFAGIYAEGVNGLNYPIDFPNDLNACFKYIVPKLPEENVVLRKHGDNWHAVIYPVPKETPITAVAKSPAIAFCKAVEQLKDA